MKGIKIMDYHYRLNGDHYVLHDGDTPIGEPLNEVAIALDAESGTLHKHGAPVHVAKWLEKAKRRFIQGGFPDMARDLVMIEGRFPLEDLNRCLSTSGFAGRLYARIQAESQAIDAEAIEILDPTARTTEASKEVDDLDLLEVIEQHYGPLRPRVKRC